MRIIFYSDQCDYSIKLLTYLDKNNIKSLFKLINVDKITPPKEIDIVPTIVDTTLNHVKELPTNPVIQEDDKAIKSETTNLNLDNQSNSLFSENEATTFYEKTKNNNDVLKVSQNMINHRQVQDNKLHLLYKLRGKLK